jgi:hypothetical protein
MSGKGSKARPFSVTQQEYESRWDVIFGRDIKEDNTGTSKNEFQDILSTEDCMIMEMPGTIGGAKIVFKE